MGVRTAEGVGNSQIQGGGVYEKIIPLSKLAAIWDTKVLLSRGSEHR
jgi:hypothetical protein